MASNNNYTIPKPYAVRAVPKPQSYDVPAPNLKIIKTDIAPTGEAVQLVRPVAADPGKSSEEIVSELINKFDYKRNDVVRGDQ